MPGSYPKYTDNTQDTQYDIPGRKDLANAADYNDHDREILAHQAILVNHNGRIVLLEAAASPSLSSLSDTSISLPASGQILVYNGSSWVNAFDIFPDYSASLPITISNGAIGFNSTYLSPSGIPFSSIHMTSTNLQDAVVEAFFNPAQVANHATLTNLDFDNSGHTGFQPSGNYLTEESDTLQSVTSRGNSSTNPIVLNASGIFQDISVTSRVGIGTTSPTEKLEVIGNIKATNAYFTGKLTVDGAIDPTYIEFTQVATPDDPASGKNRIYFKSDDKLYRLDSAGSEVEIGAGGSSPLTTKGDLYTHSTVDDRLAVGTDGYILSVDSGEATGLKWIPAASAGQTPWASDIDGAGYDLANVGDVTATALITSGGTSSQFVKGDGTLDDRYYPKAEAITKVRELTITGVNRPHGDTYINDVLFLTTNSTPAKLIKFTDLDNDLSANTEVELTGYSDAGGATTDGTYVYIITTEAVLKYDPSDDSYISIHSWGAGEILGAGACITYFNDYLYVGTCEATNPSIFKMDLTGTTITTYSGVGAVHSITPVMSTNYLAFSSLNRQVGKIDTDTDTVTVIDVDLESCDDLVSFASSTVLVTSEEDSMLGVLDTESMALTYHISMGKPVWGGHMSRVDASVYYSGPLFAKFDPYTYTSQLYNLPEGVSDINEIFITSSGKMYGTNYGYSFTIYELELPVEGEVSTVVINNAVRTTHAINDVKLASGYEFIYLKGGSFNSIEFRIDESGYLSDYWKSDGTSTATGDWDLGEYGLTTTGEIKAGDLETGSTNAFYFGDKTTDGSWRFIRDGNNMSFQRLESSIWVQKGVFTP